MEKNEVYVSQNINDESMWRKELSLTGLHWINEPAVAGEVLSVRLRHRGELKKCTLHGSVLSMDNPERAVAAGQSAVLYRGNQCIGGGIVTDSSLLKN